MPDLSTQLRDTVRALFSEGTIALAIGYERGSLPLRTTPCFVCGPEQVDRLLWDASCENNLVTYLRGLEQKKPAAKIAVVVKGCDGRSLVGMVVERQLRREDLYIIAVPCEGVIDRKKIAAHVAPGEILEALVAGDEIVLTVAGDGLEQATQRLPLGDYLCDNCLTCRQRVAPLHDVLLGEPPPEIEVIDEYPQVHAIEVLDAAGRWAYFSREFSRCIRCYACRAACPLCYCSECFVDQTQPAWFGKTDDLSDTLIFHLVRALHLAGRCVDCGACVRACPMGIDLRSLSRKMAKEVRERYHYESGMDLETVPPLATFRQDDPQEFIK